MRNLRVKICLYKVYIIQLLTFIGTCLLSKLSIPRLHDEDVSTIATHRPTKTVLQKEPYLQNKEEPPPPPPPPHPTQHTQHPNTTPPPSPTHPRGKKDFN